MVSESSAPEPGPRSRTAEAMANVRRTPLFRSLVPMEAGVGWPIPVVPSGRLDGDAVTMKLPLFGMQPAPEPGVAAHLYAPFATVSLDWKTLRIVEYVDLRHKGVWPDAVWEQSVGSFPHDAVSVSRGEYLARRAALLDRYDELFGMLAQRREPSVEWSQDFADLLAALVEPGLLPFLRQLGPKFFTKYLGADTA